MLTCIAAADWRDSASVLPVIFGETGERRRAAEPHPVPVKSRLKAETAKLKFAAASAAAANISGDRDMTFQREIL